MPTPTNRLKNAVLTVTLCWGLTAQAYEFAGGTGEPNDPYQIATAEQLISIGSDPNLLDQHFILVSDIDLDPNLPGGQVFVQAVVAPDLEPVEGFQGVAFTGCFDGRAHSIRHLTVQGGQGHYLGLFGRIGEGGRVHNLRMTEAFVCGVDGSRYLGMLAGYVDQARITSCRATGLVRGGNRTTSLGGLIGFIWLSQIAQCSVECSVLAGSNSTSLGGMAGNNAGTIVHCCIAGDVSSGNDCRYVGGLVGRNFAVVTGKVSGRIVLSYAVTRVTTGDASEDVGGLVGGDGGYCGGSFWDVEASGVSASAGGVGLTTAAMYDPNVYMAAGWDLVDERLNGTADLWLMPEGGGYPILTLLSDELRPHRLDGSGTPDDPYRVATEEDLGAISHHDWAACYRLMANIDLSGIAWTTAPIWHFDGRFDGNGFAVSNLTIRGKSFLGLFGFLGCRGNVRNLRMGGSDIMGESDGGSVAALVGWNDGYVVNCHAQGRIVGDSGVGGLVGSNTDSGVIISCSAAGSLRSESGYGIMGGLVGVNSGGIANSQACAEITSKDGAPIDCLGGLVGLNLGWISRCCADSSVVGDCVLGGLAGSHRQGTIVDCYATGSVCSREDSVSLGGLVGYADNGTTANCYAAVRLLNGPDRWDWGGLVGWGRPDPIIHSFWDIEISGATVSTGGAGLVTHQMRMRKSFTGWDFEDVWMICEGRDYPRLRWEKIDCSEP